MCSSSKIFRLTIEQNDVTIQWVGGIRKGVFFENELMAVFKSFLLCRIRRV